MGSRVSTLKGDPCVRGAPSPVHSKDPSTSVIGVGACPGVTGPHQAKGQLVADFEWHFSEQRMSGISAEKT